MYTPPAEDVQYVAKAFEKDERMTSIFRNAMFPPPKVGWQVMEKLPEILADLRPYDQARS